MYHELKMYHNCSKWLFTNVVPPFHFFKFMNTCVYVVAYARGI